MSSTPTKFPVERRELAFRRSEGIEVSLVWISAAEALCVVVRDKRSRATFELVVDSGKEALDVYRHPFAYAALRGVDYELGADSLAA